MIQSSIPGRNKKNLRNVRPAMRPTQNPMQLVPGLFSERKSAGTWRWPLCLVQMLRMSGSMIMLAHIPSWR